jgi:hypothetical protein
MKSNSTREPTRSKTHFVAQIGGVPDPLSIHRRDYVAWCHANLLGGRLGQNPVNEGALAGDNLKIPGELGRQVLKLDAKLPRLTLP